MFAQISPHIVFFFVLQLLTGLYRDTQTSITDSSAAYKVNNNRVRSS